VKGLGRIRHGLARVSGMEWGAGTEEGDCQRFHRYDAGKDCAVFCECWYL